MVGRRRSVFVLDSGIGGMTVVKAIKDLDPTILVTYLSDNLCFPYGGLTADALVERVCDIVKQALEHFQFDAVVIACNTASTVVLDSLRRNFSVPIVGVVPPIKTAAQISQSSVIGLLATEGTVRREYVDNLIEQFASDCQIHRFGCPDLAPLAEDKIRGHSVDKRRLRSNLAPLASADFSSMDVIILGCTHFPILREELEEEYCRDVIWLDPALPVARRLMDVLDETGPNQDKETEFSMGNIIFFTREHEFPNGLPLYFKTLGFRGHSSWPPIHRLT